MKSEECKDICESCSNDNCNCKDCDYPGQQCTEGCGIKMTVEHLNECKSSWENRLIC